MRRSRIAIIVWGSLLVGGFFFLGALAAGLSSAQNVAYHGKLQIGFSDSDNTAGFRRNTAVPICAGAGSQVNPGTWGTTLGTLQINATGTASPGVGGSLTFHAVDGGHGGAQTKNASTCRSRQEPFANPRIRSRTQVGSAYFPGRKGKYTSMIESVAVPTTPTATYMLSAGGGNNQSVTLVTWTTMATPSASSMFFAGPALSAHGVRLRSSQGVQRIQPGPNRFGGGIPLSGGGGLHFGFQLFDTLAPPPTPFFVSASYQNGFIPFGPQFIGTDAKGINIQSPVTSLYFPPAATFTAGLIAGRQNHTFAARTPGGTTQFAHGAIRTLAGGNTVTAGPSCPDPMVPCAPPIVSTVAYEGAFFEWTTGSATHTNMWDDWTTVRKASGFDVAVAPSSAISGETRHIQLVTPWTASYRPLGPFSLFVPRDTVGGVAVLDIRVIPAPEPSFAPMLGLGVAVLVASATARRCACLPVHDC